LAADAAYEEETMSKTKHLWMRLIRIVMAGSTAISLTGAGAGAGLTAVSAIGAAAVR
jgi:hypothetical protein